MENINSVLIFEKYIVDEVYFKVNDLFEQGTEKININVNIIPDVKIEGNSMDVTLITNVFEDAEKNNYPFEMKIKITGKFLTKDENNLDKFRKNAIAILYPYVRAIVSTYTASANIAPLILPAINVNKLIEDQEKKYKKD